jgi:hypothetical protein
MKRSRERDGGGSGGEIKMYQSTWTPLIVVIV